MFKTRVILSKTKKIANTFLRPLGVELIRRQASTSWRSSFERLKERNIVFNSVIDVGASNGKWSLELAVTFPQAKYLLIEAQSIHENTLQDLVRKKNNFAYRLAAAGDKEGAVFFDAAEPFGGQASHQPLDKETVVELPMTTVDVEVKRSDLAPPFLLKLDTHGFEIPIFEGAADTLKQTSVICVETYNFQLCDGCLRFHEMCAFLEGKGFRPFRLCNPAFRPADGVFWQMDLVLVRSDRSEFLLNSYR